MILEKMEVTTELCRVICGECGGVYAISERYRKQKEERGGYWHCPYCDCSWGFSKEVSLIEKAQLEARIANDGLARERAAHEQTTMSLRSHKAAKTRLKNRIANGICPCCTQYFKNLDEHIKNEHPKYVDENE